MLVRFKAIGAANQVDPMVVEFPRDTRFETINEFLKKSLQTSTLWCYIGNAFVPSIDETIDEIAGMTAMKENEALLVTYSLVEAFG